MITEDQAGKAVEQALDELGLSPQDYNYVSVVADDEEGVVRCAFYDVDRNLVGQKEVPV